jgi:hypothetical protein
VGLVNSDQYNKRLETDMSKNGQKTIAAVREVATERPYAWEGECAYVVQDEHSGECSPGCLIGQGLWRAKIIDSSFYNHSSNVNTSIGALVDHFGFDADEARWLNDVQCEQDTQVRWADAVAFADRRMRNRLQPTE